MGERGWVQGRVVSVAALRARVGPRAADTLFILLAIVIASSQILSSDVAPTLILNDVASSILAASATVSLWWRRSHPELVTVIGIVLVVISAIYIVAMIGLFTVAVRRRDRVLVGLAVIGTVATIMGTSWVDGITAESVAASTVAQLIAVLTGAYIGVRRDLLASLRAQVEQADAERELRVAQARTAERSRIAREMHDVLAHKVSLIALHAGGLEVSSAGGAPEVEQTAQLIGATARQALIDLRDVLGVLRAGSSADGADLAPQPTVTDLPDLVESSRQAGVRIDLRMDDVDPPEIVGRTAYRVVQEALTNVHKHARGAATQVTITGTEGEAMNVEVRNDPPAGGPRDLPGSGAGLAGLRERVDLLGGSLEFGATHGRGWIVTATIPWPARSMTPQSRAHS